VQSNGTIYPESPAFFNRSSFKPISPATFRRYWIKFIPLCYINFSSMTVVVFIFLNDCIISRYFRMTAVVSPTVILENCAEQRNNLSRIPYSLQPKFFKQTPAVNSMESWIFPFTSLLKTTYSKI